MSIDFIDKQLFKDSFNSDGYVLDFTNRSFSSFTQKSIGIDIKEKYELSKGKSLERFVEEESDGLILKLISDLVRYYFNLPSSSNERSIEKDEMIKKVESALEKYKTSSNVLLDGLKQNTLPYFGTSYIQNQFDFMVKSIETSPTIAIGKSKELIESCFKYILDSEDIEYDNSMSITELQKRVFSNLDLRVEDNLASKTNNDVKLILSSLNQVIQGINKLRNDKGDGHGKGKNFQELPSRYARLVVHSAIAVVNFILETYNYKKGKRS